MEISGENVQIMYCDVFHGPEKPAVKVCNVFSKETILCFRIGMLRGYPRVEFLIWSCICTIENVLLFRVVGCKRNGSNKELSHN